MIYQPPNSWENTRKEAVKVYLIHSKGEYWSTRYIRTLKFSEYMELSTLDIPNYELNTGISLLYPSYQDLPNKIDVLPREATWVSSNPAWRASSGIRKRNVQTSYQAEIEPLPERATLLTFHPFIQFGAVNNYLFILNVTQKPQVKKGKLWIIDSKNGKKIDSVDISTNSANCIGLDVYEFAPEDLPIFYSPDMAGIPFGIGVAKSNEMISMEHTHPPASLVIFGNRRDVQAKIKNNWIEKFQ